MAITKLPDYPAQLGPKLLIEADVTGPASYDTGGQVIGTQNDMTGVSLAGLGTVDGIIGSSSFSVSGAYQVFVQPTGTGSRKTWILLWNGTGGVASVVQNVAGSGMTPGTYALSASGGGGTGFAGTVTVLTATTISTPVITNPGRGYTSAPTITSPGTGGTPPTYTVTVSTNGPVAGATNLSGETVRLGFIGR